MAVTTQSFRSALGGLALAASIGATAPAWAAGDILTGSITGSVSGLPVPRFVSLKSDRVNARSGPNKDQDVRWVYTHVGMGTRDSIFFETLWPREIPAMQRELAAEFVGTFSLVTEIGRAHV